MYKHFSTEFFTANRTRLRELFVGTAPIVITANGLLQRNGDSTFQFRQDSNFWYLTGSNQPDLTLVIDKGKEYIILPQQQPYYDVFSGGYDPVQISQVSGIATVLNHDEGWKQLSSRLKRVKHVATLASGPSYIKELGFYPNPSRRHLIRQLRKVNPDVELLDLRPQLAIMRMVKQEPELAALQEAIDITCQAIRSVQKRQFDHEYEIETALTTKFRKQGASGHGFTPIVVAGANACILHKEDNSGPIGSKDMVTLDVGAEVENYTADITRTYMPSGKPSKRQRDIHAAVLAVQDYALTLVKPGANIRENELKIEHFMGEKLRELGLIKTIDRENVRRFFPHATSHYLGLDPHDTGDYSRPLEPGMVLTVEPGIYVREEGIGVRIEDDVVVTNDGCEVLSRRLPRDLC